MNNTSNLSDEGTLQIAVMCFLGRNQTTIEKYRRIVTFSVLAMLIIVANLIMIVTIFRRKQYQKLGNLYYVSTAASDLISGIFVLPILVSFIANGNSCGSFWICTIWENVDLVSSSLSFYNFCALSIDRYQAVRNPVKHRIANSTMKVLCRILVVWGASALLVLAVLLYLHQQLTDIPRNNFWCFALNSDPILITTVLFYCPLALMIFLYSLIVYSLTKSLKMQGKDVRHFMSRTQNRCIQRRNGNSTKTSISGNNVIGAENLCFKADETPNILVNLAPTLRKSHETSERKPIWNLGIIMLAFTLTWLPFLVVFPLCFYVPSVPAWIKEMAISLIYAGAATNPLMYLLTNAARWR